MSAGEENPFGSPQRSNAPAQSGGQGGRTGGGGGGFLSRNPFQRAASNDASHIGNLPTPTRFRDVKVELIHKIEASQDATVNAAVLLPSSTREDGVICCGEDRTIRVYLRRESGIFWPSVCNYASSPVSTLSFNAETRRLFCGLDNGQLNEYLLASDCNSLPLKKQLAGTHSKRVVAVLFSLRCEWILSAARDRVVAWHDSESGQRVGQFSLTSVTPTSLAFDDGSAHLFVGDSSGAVTMFRLLESGERQVVTSIHGHSATVSCLAWDASGRTACVCFF